MTHMFRFYGIRTDQEGQVCWRIHKDELKHMAVVLKKPAQVELCDGKGCVAVIHLKHFDRSRCEFDVINEYSQIPLRPQLTLVMADDITSELGDLLAPLTELAAHTLIWPCKQMSIWNKKKDRYDRLGRAAIKQSKSAYLINCKPQNSFVECVTATEHQRAIKLDPEASHSLADILKSKTDYKKICFFLGGRSGFSQKSQDILAHRSHLEVAHLGPHILRMETAMQAVVAVSRQILGSGW